LKVTTTIVKLGSEDDVKSEIALEGLQLSETPVFTPVLLYPNTQSKISMKWTPKTLPIEFGVDLK
jgi:hypothetical protein